jgi:hypothetical protein
MPWNLQMGESRGAVMDKRFNGGDPNRVRGGLFGLLAYCSFSFALAWRRSMATSMTDCNSCR